MKLLNDRIQVEILPEKNKITKSGIEIIHGRMAGYNENYFRGKVVAIGTGRRFNNGKQIPMTLKVGDYILYELSNQYKQVNGEDENDKKLYHIIYETDVYCVTTEGE